MIYVFTFVYCAKIVSERNFQKMIVDWLDATMLFARSAGVGSICFNNFLLAMDSTTHLSLDLVSLPAAHMNAVACRSTFTTSMDTSDKMACSSALVPSLSSNNSDVGYALIKV